MSESSAGSQPDLAIVTGTSSGIGAATAATLREQGLDVIGISRSAAPETTLRVDLGDLDALRDALEPLVAGRRVRAVVHSAALQVLGAAGTVSTHDWLASLRVNVVSMDLVVGLSLAGLREARGSVVAVSSVHGRATSNAIAVYASTKGAMEAWVRAAALDLGPEITVNAVAPGAIDTPMLWAHLDPNGPEAAHLVDRTPVQRVGTPQEVADLIAYLVGDKARFITGSVFGIDGGALTRLGTE
jgi:NAD(P)-dependent dehydrogenase (short-subunit alcohol dehydrogenase family)